MRDTIFIEKLRHFVGDHVAVIRDGDQGDFLPRFVPLVGRERACG